MAAGSAAAQATVDNFMGTPSGLAAGAISIGAFTCITNATVGV